MTFEEEATHQIGLPQSNRLKYEPLLPSSSELSRLICAFANTEGGILMLGILSKNNKITITGLSADFQVNVVLTNAISKLSPLPAVNQGFIEYDGKQLFVIKVEKSDQDITFNKTKYGIKAGKIYQMNASGNVTKGITMPYEIYLDEILKYLVDNPGLNNVNKHTVKEIILNNKVSVSEAGQLILKLRSSGYAKPYGERFIGVSIDTKPFLDAGGFSKTNSNTNGKKSGKNIFISYNWNNKTSANKLYDFLNAKGYSVSIDGHALEYKDSIAAFMESIRASDFAILIISEEYLKSENCMIEVLNVLKDRDSHDKILPIRHQDVKIFKPSDRIKYVEYWKSQVEAREKLLSGVNPTAAIEEIKKLKTAKRIYDDIGDFLSDISDMITNTVEEEEATSYLNIIKYIQKSI